mmetsp:Transcript_16214/g.26377  ORF Transcript_16214/g.26377 Transcript_16214/m.26377 type:complete len:328 (-) Transcript_16214:36-1019(-)
MRFRCTFVDSLLRHEIDVTIFWQRHWHPKVGIGIEFRLFRTKFRRKFFTQTFQHGSRNGKTSQRRSHLTDRSELLQHFRGRLVTYFLDLRGFWGLLPIALQHGNNTVLVQALSLPFLCSGCRISQKGTHDINMMGGFVNEIHAGQKDLIAPVHTQSALSRGRINSSLSYHCLQYRQRAGEGQFHSRFVIVLTGWQRCQASPFPGCMVQRCRNGTLGQQRIQVDATVLVFGIRTGLLPGIQSSQPVSSAGRIDPIFRHGNHHWKVSIFFGDVQFRHPKFGLMVVRRTDNRDIVVLLFCHGIHGCFEASIFVVRCCCGHVDAYILMSQI